MEDQEGLNEWLSLSPTQSRVVAPPPKSPSPPMGENGLGAGALALQATDRPPLLMFPGRLCCWDLGPFYLQVQPSTAGEMEADVGVLRECPSQQEGVGWCTVNPSRHWPSLQLWETLGQ